MEAVPGGVSTHVGSKGGRTVGVERRLSTSTDLRLMIPPLVVVLAGCHLVYPFQAEDRADAAAPETGAQDDCSFGSVPGIVEYGASVAACVATIDPDPDFCEKDTGADNLNVDLLDIDTGYQFWAFLRFDLDAKLACTDVTSVILQLVATNHVDAAGNGSGEVWLVDPFSSRADLATAVPGKKTLLAGDQGPVGQGETVRWELPTSIISSGEPIHLGIIPTSDEGVNYWDNDGPSPPLLLVSHL
jgi:hypothetical protein